MIILHMFKVYLVYKKNENEEPNIFIGKTEGEIVYPRGQKNFGLLGGDQWFTLNCTNKTYA